MRVCFEKNVHTLGFEFCKNSQPVALCSFSALKIARYVSHSAMLCLICSSDIPTQAQGVISICWDAMTKIEIANDVKWDTAQRHIPQKPRTHLEQLFYLIRCHPLITFSSVSFWI